MTNDKHLVYMVAGTTPPEKHEANVLFLDTTLPNNWVLKYWDSDEWVRMDGGSDIPDGLVEERHLSEELRRKLGL